MRIPLRSQFMLPLLAVAVASLLAVGAFNYRLASRQTKARIEQQLQGVISVLAASSYPLTDSVLRQMGGLANAEFVLTDAQGKLLASGRTGQDERIPTDTLTAGSIKDVVLGPEILLNGKSYFHSSVSVKRRLHVKDGSILHVLFAKDEFDAAWWTVFLPSVFVGIITLAAVALVTHLLTGRVGKVLSRLGREVERLAEGDFSPVRQPDWDDETKDLAIAINGTARRLGEYEQALRQTERLRTVALLGAGLAHELRNAATGCRLAIDLHAESCQSVESEESLDVARHQLLLMENRLQQLLQLGRQSPTDDATSDTPTCETGFAEENTSRRTIDFSQLVSDSVRLIEPAARHAGIRLEWDPPTEEVSVEANPETLGQAVMNLLLNALDAAAKSQTVNSADSNGSSGRFVRVTLHCHEQEVELEVADSGDGPQSELSNTVFDPFVTTKPEGVGLGLAVARRVVEAHRGKIQWERGNGVTQFSIQLPLAYAGVSHV